MTKPFSPLEKDFDFHRYMQQLQEMTNVSHMLNIDTPTILLERLDFDRMYHGYRLWKHKISLQNPTDIKSIEEAMQQVEYNGGFYRCVTLYGIKILSPLQPKRIIKDGLIYE